MIRRYLLQAFFLALFELNGFFVLPTIRHRFIKNWYWSKPRLGITEGASHQQPLYNFFAYLLELCSQQSRLVILGYSLVDLETFFAANLQDLWTNFFINGMEARFANFLNWHKMFLVDQCRSPNRRRFHTSFWWAHYTARGPARFGARDVGAVVLHKYYFRRLVGCPRVFLDQGRLWRDFPIPLPAVTPRLWLFSFVYMLIRVFFYFRARAVASRFFWDTRFHVLANKKSLGFSPTVFKFAFTLHGRQYDRMQLWEYTTFLDSFLEMPPLVAALAAEETRYDPKLK